MDPEPDTDDSEPTPDPGWSWLFPNGFLIVFGLLALGSFYLMFALSRNPYS